MAAEAGLTTDRAHQVLHAVGDRSVSLEATKIDVPHPSHPDDDTFAKLICETHVSVVRQLPPEQQAVLALHYFVGFSLQEIAELFGVPESRVGSLHILAVLAVQSEFKKLVGEDR